MRRRRRARRDRWIASAIAVVGVLVVVGAIAGVVHLVSPARAENTSADSSAASASVAATSSPASAVATASVPASTPPVATPPAETPKPAATYKTDGKRTIVVYRSRQEITLFAEDGNEVATYLCSTGEYYPVPGTYSVSDHQQASYEADLRFYYFTIFAKSEKGNNIGFHSVPIDAAGVSVGGLGQPVSHGCVRIAYDNAKLVYSWAAVGTRVVVVK
ncbi:MAG: L,D-transpeptidase [Coriobacteriia bacterium]|nr:L,D-transpeptidase [Coriobacteriia bacterium]